MSVQVLKLFGIKLDFDEAILLADIIVLVGHKEFNDLKVDAEQYLIDTIGVFDIN